MGRGKVKLAYILDNTARKVTYNKRVRGLVKKAHELSVLCGVDVCALVYSAYENAPVVFPSSDAEVRRILMEYRGRSEIDQGQRKCNHEEFLNQSVTKASEKLKRLKMKNKEIEMEIVMSELLDGKPIEQVPYPDLDDLAWVIQDKLRALELTMRKVEGPNNVTDPAFNSTGNELMGRSGTVQYETQAGQWFPSHQSAPSFQAAPSHQAGPSHSGGILYPSHYQHQP